MKKLTKLLVLLLSVALVCTGLIMVISADDTAAVEYDFDLTSAVASADADGTVILTGNAKVESAITIDKNLTIDLNGYTLYSSAETAFNVTESVTFTLTGKGSVKVDGMLFKTTNGKYPIVTVEGKANTEGIDILHTGSASMYITKAYNGTYVYRNLKIVSTYANTGDSLKNAFIYTSETQSSGAAIATLVNMTLDKVDFRAENVSTEAGEPGMFLVSVAGGTGSKLTITDSALYSTSSCIYLQHLNAGAKATEAVEIRNSVISSVAKYQTTNHNYALCLANWGTPMTGTVNVYDSLIEGSSRVIFSTNNTGTNAVNLYGSTVRVADAPGTNRGTGDYRIISRAVEVNLDENSKISFPRDKGVTYDAAPTINVAEGTRTNLLALAQSTTKAITLPDRTMGTNSSEYTWIYDPAGDPDYPYLCVKKSAVTTDAASGSSVYNSNILPYFSKNHNFEAIYNMVASDQANTATYNLLISEMTKGTYTDTEGFFVDGTKRGSLYRGDTVGNSYIRYCVTPLGDSTDETRNFQSENSSNSDPVFEIGAPRTMANNQARVAGDSRAYVSVLDFDFGTDSEIGFYPETSVIAQARSGSGATDTSNSDYSFMIYKDGNIANWLGDSTGNKKLKPAGEWNHFTAVIYTDPNIETLDKNGNTVGYSRVYIFLNGVYMGYESLAKAGYDTAETYIMGLRFNIGKNSNHYVGASFCFDNISFKAYNTYLNGETDGTTSAETAENYVTAAPATKYIKNTYSISGKDQQTDVNTALASATSQGAALDLTSDVAASQVIKTPGTIATNGYDFTIGEGSYPHETTYDIYGNEVYTFVEPYAYVKDSANKVTYVTAENVETAYASLADGDTFVLLRDVVLESAANFADGDITINLNGHTLYGKAGIATVSGATVSFSNGQLITLGDNVVSADETATVTFNNCMSNGTLIGNLGEGTAAANIATDAVLGENTVAAYYNVGMTVENDSVKVGDYYIVSYGTKDEFVAANPAVDAACVIELPLLTKKVAATEDTVTVTYNGLDGKAAVIHTYVKGGNVSDEVVLEDYTVNALKVTFTGWKEAQIVKGIQEDATVEPTYDVSATISGLRANLSIYSDFGINLYVPAAYDQYVTAITTNDGNELLETAVEVEVGGVNYNKVTVYREAYAATDNVKLTFAITPQEYMGTTYDNLSCTATINVASYAAKVLAAEGSTAADKSLMNYMLTYANEASKYFEKAEDATIAEMLKNVTVTPYAVETVCDISGFSSVFKSATVDIQSDDLAYVFTLKDNFAGTVTIKLGDRTYTYNRAASDSREIRISGLKIYSFARDLTINANGTVGADAATITGGVYNLATFTQYHIDKNSDCKDLVVALYNYAKNAYAYKYPTA